MNADERGFFDSLTELRARRRLAGRKKLPVSDGTGYPDSAVDNSNYT